MPEGEPTRSGDADSLLADPQTILDAILSNGQSKIFLVNVEPEGRFIVNEFAWERLDGRAAGWAAERLGNVDAVAVAGSNGLLTSRGC